MFSSWQLKKVIPSDSPFNVVSLVLLCLWFIVLYYGERTPSTSVLFVPVRVNVRSPMSNSVPDQPITTLWRTRHLKRRWTRSRAAWITFIPPWQVKKTNKKRVRFLLRPAHMNSVWINSIWEEYVSAGGFKTAKLPFNCMNMWLLEADGWGADDRDQLIGVYSCSGEV